MTKQKQDTATQAFCSVCKKPVATDCQQRECPQIAEWVKIDPLKRGGM